MQDGKGKQDYLKASAAAEGSLELALLQIKEKWYGYYDTLTGSDILGTENKDPRISYSFEGRVQTHTGNIAAYETEMIPLFTINAAWNMANIGDDLNLSIPSDASWNLVSNNWGISWIGGFNKNTETGQKKLVSVGGNIDFSFLDSVSIWSFLNSSSGSYLLLYNASDIPQNYTLSSTSRYFTKPESTIISSAKIGKYTQNLATNINNTEFLGILKYSIYSWE